MGAGAGDADADLLTLQLFHADHVDLGQELAGLLRALFQRLLDGGVDVERERRIADLVELGDLRQVGGVQQSGVVAHGGVISGRTVRAGSGMEVAVSSQ